MAEEGWGEDESVAPRKRRVPKWVWWGCGGGCLLVTLIAAVVAVFAFRTFRDATDPEKQWPKLAEVLPFDERPQGLELEAGIDIVGMSQFYLEDPARGLRATVMAFPEAARAEFDKYMNPEGELPFGFGRPLEPQEVKLTVRGREVPALRFERIEREPDAFGPGIRVDLSGSGAPRALELRRHGAGPVEDADVEAFLAPFDVWRAR
jgi:hypothetical protein